MTAAHRLNYMALTSVWFLRSIDIMDRKPIDANLAEVLDHNARAIAANNQARIRELRRYATKGFAEVFNLAPLLLNVNQPDQPAYIHDPDTPFGVKYIERQLWLPSEDRQPPSFFAPAPQAGPGAAAATAMEHQIRTDCELNGCPALGGRPVVESLFLIGSSGSVGHNASSDLDYWVCHEDGVLEGKRLALFKQKLAAISKWAREKHDTEANFYLINLTELRKGHLTRLDESETEGEVAPLLLLEEFYRTCLFVAGRQPLWPVMPLEVDADSYRRLSSELAGALESEYVDLGFPALPPPQELLAAALWLARKSEADPFKGLLKIMVLLDYVESDLTRDPLCHKVKEDILSTAEEELPVDPYIVTINRVTEYGAVYLSPEELDLLRMASALKIIGGDEGQSAFFIPGNSPKRQLLSQWAKKWNWSRDRIVHLVNYSAWPERDQLNFGGELLNMLTGVYIRIAQYLIKKYPGQINPQDDELAPLAARLLTRMGGLGCTVETLPSQIHYKSVSGKLFLEYDKEGLWLLHALGGSDSRPGEHNLIYGCPRAAKAAAWLVHNRIYSPDKDLSLGSSASGYPAADDFKNFLELLRQAFPYFELRHCDLDNLWSTGGQGKIVLALNFEIDPEETPELVTADMIIRTGWGEMRHFLVETGGGAPLADRYLKIIKTILKECGSKVRPESLLFLPPATAELRKAMMNIKGGLSATAKRKRPDGLGKSRIDI